MNRLERIVNSYIQDHQHRADKEQHWFAIQPSLRKAIEVAALAQSPGGKRLSHQRRIPGHVLKESSRRLLTKLTVIERAHTFDDLFDIVSNTIRPIYGIGELAIYDTALRIGAYLGLEPTKVYLHAGTRTGANTLGLDTSQEYLPLKSLPKELRALKPYEIEDVLCIYKHGLKGSRCG